MKFLSNLLLCSILAQVATSRKTERKHRILRGQSHGEHEKQNQEHRQLMGQQPGPAPAPETCAALNEQSAQCGASGNKPSTCCDIDAICNGKFCSSPATPVPTPSPPANNQDAFGITKLYVSDDTKLDNDWTSDWISTRNINGAFQYDPNDDRCLQRGSGSFDIGNGKMTANYKPRLYINKTDTSQGWENVEFTAYGKYVNDGGILSYSGLTMAARTNHGDFDNGCTAAGYYARIYRNTGEVSLQKEYFHGSYTVYTSSNRVDFFDPAEYPVGQTIGIKFVVYTVPSSSNVKLEIYVDMTEGVNGGTWVKAHEYLDTPGAWPKTTSSQSIDSNCEIQSGDTVLGARDFCFLRTDGDEFTEVEWSKASVRNIVAPN